MKNLLLIPAAALMLAGCNHNEPLPKGCDNIDGIRICTANIAGRECSIIRPDSEGEEIRCRGDEDIMCNNIHNDSGNVCKVRVGGKECVAVLPDGGKSPKDYKEFTTCPKEDE